MNSEKSSRKVAGAIPIYEKDSVVLVSNYKGNLIFPKGGVKKKESFSEACKREAMEEGGIEGEVVEQKKYKKRGIIFYILVVSNLLDDYIEKSKRERVILKIEEASKDKRVPQYAKDILNDLLEKKINS